MSSIALRRLLSVAGSKTICHAHLSSPLQFQPIPSYCVSLKRLFKNLRLQIGHAQKGVWESEAHCLQQIPDEISGIYTQHTHTAEVCGPGCFPMRHTIHVSGFSDVRFRSTQGRKIVITVPFRHNLCTYHLLSTVKVYPLLLNGIQ